MMETISTAFDPGLHGFIFANYFDIKGSGCVPRTFFARISLPKVVYGLCGGMCYLALDYFHAGQPIPDITQRGEIPPNLFLRLWHRQLASLAKGTVVRVLLWMALSSQTLAKKTSQNEIPKLRKLLDRGRPAVLLLVRTRLGQNPTHNHQVVAVGYIFESASQQMTIHLYDPNHPGETPAITLDLAHPDQGIQLAQTSGEPLRGFFVLDYQPELPS